MQPIHNTSSSFTTAFVVIQIENMAEVGKQFCKAPCCEKKEDHYGEHLGAFCSKCQKPSDTSEGPTCPCGASVEKEGFDVISCCDEVIEKHFPWRKENGYLRDEDESDWDEDCKDACGVCRDHHQAHDKGNFCRSCIYFHPKHQPGVCDGCSKQCDAIYMDVPCCLRVKKAKEEKGDLKKSYGDCEFCSPSIATHPATHIGYICGRCHVNRDVDVFPKKSEAPCESCGAEGIVVWRRNACDESVGKMKRLKTKCQTCDGICQHVADMGSEFFCEKCLPSTVSVTQLYLSLMFDCSQCHVKGKATYQINSCSHKGQMMCDVCEEKDRLHPATTVAEFCAECHPGLDSSDWLKSSGNVKCVTCGVIGKDRVLLRCCDDGAKQKKNLCEFCLPSKDPHPPTITGLFCSDCFSDFDERLFIYSQKRACQRCGSVNDRGVVLLNCCAKALEGKQKQKLGITCDVCIFRGPHSATTEGFFCHTCSPLAKDENIPHFWDKSCQRCGVMDGKGVVLRDCCANVIVYSEVGDKSEKQKKSKSTMTLHVELTREGILKAMAELGKKAGEML